MALRTVLNGTLSDDRNSVKLTMLLDGVPSGSIILESPEVDELIQRMAALRSQMTDPVPLELDAGSRLLAEETPKWVVRQSVNMQQPEVLLALRHPGLGWIANRLPQTEAVNLGQSLLNSSYGPSRNLSAGHPDAL